jgi:uncharacterized protein YlxW (UPF0749 family)
MTLNEILTAAREHADRLQDDIKQASNRVDHIRMTTRANEAAHLVTNLETMQQDATDVDGQN